MSARGNTARRDTRPALPVSPVAGFQLLVLDPHPIFRTGLGASLASFPEIAAVHEVATTEEALEHSALECLDIVIMEHDDVGGPQAIRRLRDATDARILVCSSRRNEDQVLAAIEAGAVGYLSKQTLTPRTLRAAVQATATGGGIVAPELLAPLLQNIARVSREELEPRGLTLARLSNREQRVLELLADGRSTREVAYALSYSERTVKNILHDIGTKFNARTRSQAVAHAVRAGLI